jgi:hypothetical protein
MQQDSKTETVKDSCGTTRDLGDAGLHAQWAEWVLDDLPGSGLGCETTEQRLAAAQAHALLSLAARIAELIDTVRAGAEGTRTELEALRCDGISEVGVSGTVAPW